MRHKKRRSQLSVMPSHRKAMLRNMVRNLIAYQSIETTVARAKETRRLAEHTISIAKEDTVNARRRAYMVLGDRDLVMKLFKEIVPLFKDRTSGFTRIIPLGFRRGDGASMAILELVEKKAVEKKAPAKKKAAKADDQKKADAKKAENAKDTPAAEKKAEHKVKPISKSKPTLEEEKMTEKAKAEDRKIDDKKKFLGNLRGFFHRKTDM